MVCHALADVAPGPLSLTDGDGLSALGVGLVVVGVTLVLAAGGWLLVRRRRRVDAPEDARRGG
ncbi:MAG: hypothetical protein CSA66_07810 [Proteobacteria bacterium]|nr:MAG: hypothetical protein CSA66_07810 [Pseudomonadota bacterium]